MHRRCCVLIVVALVFVACTSSSHRSSPPSSTASTTTTSTTTTSTTPAPLPVVQDGQHADVPWSAVGPGWVLAVQMNEGPDGAHPTIVLLDPTGVRYDLGPAPAGQLADWSGDGRTALFESSCGRCDPRTTATLIDLETGSTHDVKLDGEVQFTRPDGRALLEYGTASGSVRRVSLIGDTEIEFPAGIRLVSSPDGTQLALTTSDGYQIVTKDGDAVRLVSPPAAIDSCILERWLPDDNLLVRCDGKFWAVPASGDAPSMLDSATTDNLVALFPMSDGYAVEIDNSTAGKCSSGVGLLDASGITTKLDVPGAPVDPTFYLVGTEAGRMLITFAAQSECLSQDPVTLAWFDPTTQEITALLTDSTGGSGIQAVPFGH